MTQKVKRCGLKLNKQFVLGTRFWERAVGLLQTFWFEYPHQVSQQTKTCQAGEHLKITDVLLTILIFKLECLCVDI
jgi:hypothetical protein